MAERCITIDGALVRVAAGFDASPDSEDMKAMRAVIAAAKAKFADMPEVTLHPFEPEPDQVPRMPDTVTLERDDWHTIAAALLTIDHYTGGHDGIHLVAKISVQIDPPPEGPLP